MKGRDKQACLLCRGGHRLTSRDTLFAAESIVAIGPNPPMKLETPQDG
jgi:hypothetical protein